MTAGAAGFVTDQTTVTEQLLALIGMLQLGVTDKEPLGRGGVQHTAPPKHADEEEAPTGQFEGSWHVPDPLQLAPIFGGGTQHASFVPLQESDEPDSLLLHVGMKPL